MEITGKVNSIIRLRINSDGEGVGSVVFLQDCPLTCVYQRAAALSKNDDNFSLDCAINYFNSIIDWKDSRELCVICHKKKQILMLTEDQRKQQKSEEGRQQSEEKAENERKNILETRMANGRCAFCGGEFRNRLFHKPECKNCGRKKSY